MPALRGSRGVCEDLVLTRSEYTAYCKAPYQCPKCGSREITGGSHEADADWMSVAVTCAECDAEWEDIHDFCDMGKVKIVPDAAEICLDVYGIVVKHDGKGGATIRSNLFRVDDRFSVRDNKSMEASMICFEAMILACAREGIEIDSPAFKCAIETVVDEFGKKPI